ncbi:metalloregulator ArsR/SmtB family transcription factor [Salinicoccus halitifaciens]|uniref:ArsR family transcriptional regulator n=1 Tax=Salinicoccus halitifaciens TaxID=1073415 RepID=A0ABV2E8Q5_9STAP|nr:metalloregulator ArsR/SmtB family transcription factor [Salinicoccus halitifaciens]
MQKDMVKSDPLKEYEQIFKALADEKRLKILHLLADSPLESQCVCDLTEDMEMAQSKLSYHLKILLRAGLINQTKKGTWHYYSLNDENISAVLSDGIFQNPRIKRSSAGK